MTTTDASSLADIDLTDASVWERAAPHEWLDRLRSEDPVHWHEESDGPGFWALTATCRRPDRVDGAGCDSRAGSVDRSASTTPTPSNRCAW